MRLVTPDADRNGNASTTPPPAPPSRSATPSIGSNAHALPTFSMKIPAAPAPAPVPAAPEPPAIFVPLADLLNGWPDELKKEIMGSPLAGARVPLPGSLIEPGLKRGRVTITWEQLRTLVKPGSAASAHDHLELELPLPVIAPLYLAAKKNAPKTQTRTSVSTEIPDLFFGFPQPAAPAAPAAPAPSSLPHPAEKKNTDTNFYVRDEKSLSPLPDEVGARPGSSHQTDFLTRQAHPKEVVVRAAQLPGVAGVVVALPDGLRVASQVPPDLNADTLTAFLPQIYERVNQSTRELRMGALNNVSFTVGNVPWKIFRVNSVYFAVFGRAGEGLPSAQLAALAAEIDRKKQS
jgi:predicted regulator of Ras-like GTPase activity (Roadblock/LC7/MglB family)